MGWTESLSPLPPQSSHLSGGRVLVPQSVWNPAFSFEPKRTAVVVPAFLIDRFPVTNGQYLAFVKKNPKWQRGKVSQIFVDERYLAHWAGPISLGGTAGFDQPVTYVSWFAAEAYCRDQGGRLPTEAEWELVAAASETKPDAASDPAFRDRILKWYAVPGGVTKLRRVGESVPNYYGLYDLHGLVWEWILDYNASILSGDSRDSGGESRLLFCGAGGTPGGDKKDYASFMRYAFRNSLTAQYTSKLLGFRCVVELGNSRKRE